jgi:hypothetical protein
MWVVAARAAVLSVITGGGKWVEILAHADPLYAAGLPHSCAHEPRAAG